MKKMMWLLLLAALVLGPAFAAIAQDQAASPVAEPKVAAENTTQAADTDDDPAPSLDYDSD